MADKTKPWFKFWPGHWLGDRRLRRVSMGARGLWIDICALMAHETSAYGFLLFDGRQPSAVELARDLGATPDEVAAALEELRAGKVCGVVGDPELPRDYPDLVGLIPESIPEGTIFSRRMIRDRARSEEGREHKNRGLEGPPPRPPSRADLEKQLESGDDPASPPMTQKKKNNAEEEAEQSRASSIHPTAVIDLFDAVQAEVFGQQRRQLPAGDDFVHAKRWLEAGADLDMLRALFVAKFMKRKTDGLDAPRSLSFLKDAVLELIVKSKQSAAAPSMDGSAPSASTPEPWEQRLRAWGRSKIWMTDWGPKPGEQGCRVPAELLEKVA